MDRAMAAYRMSEETARMDTLAGDFQSLVKEGSGGICLKTCVLVLVM